ncbi:stemmadenine O-acetyltransferase-like [Cornus florida]|uniref:stemmadenine O-acetyltransferase-like n=1 Tax=Cornus florida TaxID=4283 RepID=UPI00289DB116|nr:stemmadenine O-acetyltransferase-like [Cornus florida]
MSQVEVISREMIKPSSPTPQNLRNHKLSFLDQIAPPVYIPLIFFYHPELGYDIDRAQKSQLLKQSLSDTLTRFYPLARRIKNDVYMDCNDAGVEYVEAQVHAQLSHVIENPNIENLKQYLPIEPYGTSAAMGREALLAIQINFFDCGSLAIGLCISHNIADGSYIVTFTNAWAATARGAIENVKDPTRVEAVSAFIWSHFIEVAKSNLAPKKIFVANHAVNLRSRMNPPLLDHAMGNIWRIATALSMCEGEIGFGDLLRKLRSAIRKIDSDYVKILKIGDGYLDYLKRATENFSNGELCWRIDAVQVEKHEYPYGCGRS